MAAKIIINMLVLVWIVESTSAKGISDKAIAGPTSISEVGAVEVIGAGSGVAEHSSSLTVSGSSDVPAILNLNVGSGANLNQYASNYQQTLIGADGVSSAYQENSGTNSGSAYDSLSATIQGLQVDSVVNGWSAVEGEGVVGQADTLSHQGPNQPSNSGWKKP